MEVRKIACLSEVCWWQGVSKCLVVNGLDVHVVEDLDDHRVVLVPEVNPSSTLKLTHIPLIGRERQSDDGARRRDSTQAHHVLQTDRPSSNVRHKAGQKIGMLLGLLVEYRRGVKRSG